MNRAEWDSTKDLVAMLRFACLRIPRRQLVLLLARLLERSVYDEFDDEALSLPAFAVATVRAWVFQECSNEELLRVSSTVHAWLVQLEDIPERRFLEPAAALLSVASWLTQTPEPGSSWGLELRPDEFVGVVEFVGRELRYARAADDLRRRLVFPATVARDWMPQLPLVFAGTQILTVKEWDIVHAASLGAPHDVPPEVLVLRDELLTSQEPENPAQAAERARVQAIVAARGSAAPSIPAALAVQLERPETPFRADGRPDSHESALAWTLRAALTLPVCLWLGVLWPQLESLPDGAEVGFFVALVALVSGVVLAVRHLRRRVAPGARRQS